MLNTLLRLEEEKISHLSSVEDVFHKSYKYEPRTNVRLRMGVFAGGGSRGLISLQIAKAIDEKIQQENAKRIKNGEDPIKHSFIDTLDVMSGASTGAIISCLLALRKSTDRNSPDFKKPKYSVDDVIEIYKKALPEIFGFSKLNTVQAILMPWKMKKFKAIGGSIYTNKGLKKILKREFDGLLFNEKNFLIPITIPVIDITNGHQLSFRTEDNLNNSVEDVLLATTAATPYLLPHTATFEWRDGPKAVSRQRITAVDGGFSANIPNVELDCHYCSTKNPVKKRSLRYFINQDVLTSKTMITFGTGDYNDSEKKKVNNRMALFSFLFAFSASFRGVKERTTKVIENYNLLHNNKQKKNGRSKQYSHDHLVLDIELDQPISLSASSKKTIKILCQEGKRAADLNKKQIDQYVKRDFTEYLLKKCDVKMQEHVKTKEFEERIRKLEFHRAKIEMENLYLNFEGSQYVECMFLNGLQKKSDFIKHKSFDRFKKGGVPAQSVVKSYIHNLNHSLEAVQRLNDEAHLHIAFSDHPVQSELMSSSSLLYGRMTLEKQKQLYKRYFFNIKRDNPELIPDENSSMEERKRFSRLIGQMYAASLG
ncbi:MAG: patatin-like phospholipase family protein [Alphaproteobacteria bacterium]|nr:patatin-like phospholipase family protein [Alphaproteobacteria bacterium]